MGTLQSGAHASPFPATPSASMITLNSSGSGHIALVRMPDSGANIVLRLRFSSDNGATWADTTGGDINRSAIQTWSGLRIDGSGHIHVVYRTNESSEDRVYYRRWRREDDQYTLESEVLVASGGNGGVAGAKYQGVDIVSHGTGTDKWRLPIAVGTTTGSTVGVTMFGIEIYKDKNKNWVRKVNNSIFTGTRAWLTTGSGSITPSIDLNNEEGLFVTWSRPGTYVTRMGYSSSTKTWAGGSFSTGVTKLQTTGITVSYTNGRFDGSRFLVPLPVGSVVTVYQRSATNAAQTTLTSPTHPQGAITHVAFSFVTSTIPAPAGGSFRLYATGTTTGVLYYVDYTRSTNTWGSWTSMSVTPATNNQFGVKNRNRRTDQGNHFVYYETPSATAVTAAQILQIAPNTSTLTGPSRTDGFGEQYYTLGNGGLWGNTTALTFSWIFSDSDLLDTMTNYALKRVVTGGSTQYFRASDNTWQASEVMNAKTTTTSNQNASQLLGSTVWDDSSFLGAQHTFSLKVRDTQGLDSAYGPGYVVIPSADATPTLTYPLPQTGGTVVTVPNPTFTWTASGTQTAFRIKVSNDDDDIIHDSGWVVSTDLSYTLPAVINNTDGPYYTEIYLKNTDGMPTMLLGSNAWSSFNASIPAPPTPTIAASPNSNLGAIAVTTTNPAPGGGEPAFDYAELYRREVGDTLDGVRIATDLTANSTYQDFTAASGVAYEYRSKTFGVNLAFAYSAWTP